MPLIRYICQHVYMWFKWLFQRPEQRELTLANLKTVVQAARSPRVSFPLLPREARGRSTYAPGALLITEGQAYFVLKIKQLYR